MRKGLMVVLGLGVALMLALSSFLAFGTSPRKSVAYPNFVCVVALNTYAVCVGPPTTAN